MENNAAGITDGFVQTRQHGRIHFRQAGEGEVLLLLHSNGGSAYQFDATAMLLAPHCRVVSWSMPGHGDSDPLARHYAIEEYADAVAEFMDAMKIDKAFVVGSSVGGSIAAAFGGAHAKRALAVMVIEAPCRTYEEWGARWGHTEGNFSIPLQDEKTIRQRVPAANAAVMTRWNIDRSKAGAWTMVDVMWALRAFDVRAALAKVTVPGSIVYGRSGPNIGDRDRLHTSAPGMPVEVLEESGHFPMLDCPDKLAELLLKALASGARK